MSDCDKGTGNCPSEYKNIQSESFGDGKRVTSDLLFQFCKNDTYLYNEILKLWDKTDPEHRKRFYPPYYMDSAKSYGIEPIKYENIKEEDKAKVSPLDYAYHLSNTLHERYEVDFDYSNDTTYLETNSNNTIDTLVINNDNIIEDSSTLHIVARDDGTEDNPHIMYSVLPTPVSKTVSNEIPFTTYTTTTITNNVTKPTTEKVTTKKDVFGKLTLDANCSGPYKNWTANSVWYIGYNRHKNYNIKNNWRKNPDDTSIPSVCRGQTFKAEHTGELRKVTFKMRGSNKSVSPCIVEIRTVGKNGKPTQKVLARTEQKFNHSSSAMVNFTFKKPCQVEKGTSYAIVLRSPLSNFNHCYWIVGWASTCFSNSRKRAYYDGETFLSEDNGKTWIVHGTKEKCYGSHYYDWGFAEAPVNFGFEVYIAQKTGTKTITTKVPVNKTVSSNETVTVKKTDYVSSSVNLNYYEKGDYYLEFKPFVGNFYTGLVCTYNIDNSTNLNHGNYEWEIFNPNIDEETNEVIGWQSFTDFNMKSSTSTSTSNNGDKNYRINFNYALTYVKVRLKLTLTENILADVNSVNDINTELSEVLDTVAMENGATVPSTAVSDWKEKIYDEFAWANSNHKPLSIRQLASVEFTLDKKPSFKGYLRTLEYHPVQEGMLPACIWSEVDVDGVPKNNGECKIDIVHEKNCLDRVLLYRVDNLDLRDYIVDYDENQTLGSFTTGEDVKDYIINNVNGEYVFNEEFINYLQKQTPKVYILPYKYTNRDNETSYLYFFGDEMIAPIELDDYLAYPVNSCSIGTEDIHLNLKNTIADNGFVKHTFTGSTNEFISYTHSESLEGNVKGVTVIYKHINPVGEGDIEVEELNLVENQDYVIEENKLILNINKKYNSDDTTYPLLHSFINLGNNITMIANNMIFEDETEILVVMKGYDYNEFQHYLTDYDNKRINFYNPLSLPEGEIKVDYNPLWVRDLEVSDFPLKMDLWTEYYVCREEDGVNYFDRCKINPCGKISLIEDETFQGGTSIITKVPPLDNIRKLEIQDWDGNAKLNSEMIEDIDYTVDYLQNKISFRENNKISDNDIIMIKYTPNLTDNGLSIAYRIRRPLYLPSGAEVREDWVINKNSEVNIGDNEDNYYILSNYFTTRT